MLEVEKANRTAQNKTMPRPKTIVIVTLVVLLVLGVATVIIFRHPIARAVELREVKSDIARHLVTPVDLTGPISNYGTPASILSRNTRFLGWRVMPYGFQVFDHVPFQVDGAIFLWGRNNAQKLHIVFPEEIPDIEVNQKFGTLYLLHCAFFASPPKTPVYQVVFHYEDDDASPVTNSVLYDEDILDWYGNKARRPVPTSPRTKLVWFADAPEKKSLVRLWVTAITNPVPFIKVTSIDLYSCKSPNAGCIMGMTTGKAGLLK